MTINIYICYRLDFDFESDQYPFFGVIPNGNREVLATQKISGRRGGEIKKIKEAGKRIIGQTKG